MSSGLTGLITVIASPLNATGSFSIPEGWLVCDGRSYNKNSYLSLYKNLLKDGPNSTFDAVSNPLLYGGDADSFNVPNLNNRFMRGYKDGDATVQPGQYTQEEVNLSGLTAIPSNSQVTLSQNSSSYSSVTQSISANGEHNHMYAQGGGDGGQKLGTYAELDTQRQFFHTRVAIGSQLQGQGFPTHLRDFRQSGNAFTTCDLSYDHYSMWSVIQGGGSGYQLAIPNSNHNLSSLFGGQYSGQDMSQSSIREKTFTTMLVSSLWAAGGQSGRPYGHNSQEANTAFRHIHKYSITVDNNTGHQHDINSVSNEAHSHTHTVTTNPTVQNTGTGTELRPANTKMIFLIYAK